MGGEFRTGRHVTLESIVEDAFRWVQLIPLLSQERTGLPANAVGIVYATPYTFEAAAALLERAKAVYLEAHIEASNPDSITEVRLVDATAVPLTAADLELDSERASPRSGWWTPRRWSPGGWWPPTPGPGSGAATSCPPW
jgi:hypothetical protein